MAKNKLAKICRNGNLGKRVPDPPVKKYSDTEYQVKGKMGRASFRAMILADQFLRSGMRQSESYSVGFRRTLCRKELCRT